MERLNKRIFLNRETVSRGKKTDYGTYRMSGRELLRYSCEGILAGVFITWLCYRSLRAMWITVPVTILFLLRTRRMLSVRRQWEMNLHFKDFLSSLHTGMAAGYSLENAVRAAARETGVLYGKKDPLVLELQEIVRQMSFQKPVEQLFRDLGRRSHVEDIASFGEVLMIAKRTGGDMGSILRAAWKNLCEKIDTREEIETVLAARRYEQQIMSLMPAGILLYLKISFGDFLDPLYGNPAGILIMTACLLLWTGAFVWGENMVEHAISRI